jgi:DNA-binding CsgD family transcriptional regulator
MSVNRGTGWESARVSSRKRTAESDDSEEAMTEQLHAVPLSSRRSDGVEQRLASGQTTTQTAPPRGQAPFATAPHTAYQELLGAARRHSVAVMAIASALADLTCVHGESLGETFGPAHSAAHREWGGLLGESGSLDVLASFAASLGQIVERAMLIEQLRSQHRAAEQLARSTTGILGGVRGDIPLLQSHQQAAKAPWQSRSEVVSELTRREYEVLQLMTQGATNREIATTIFLSEETVKWHVKHIMKKFGVANRGQAVATYLKSLNRR